MADAGDIGFYYNHNSPIDELIKWRTGSDIVHVSVFLDADHTIAATSGGITKQAAGNEFDVWSPPTGYEPMRLEAALGWLEGEVGKPYGVADLANQLLLLRGEDVMLLDKSEDCSDLATKFLWIAGYALPPVLIRTNAVTPGALFGVLTGRKV